MASLPQQTTPILPQNLSDETKRHIIVGIAFNNVLLQELRTVIDLRLKDLFNQLVAKHHINTQNNNLMNPKQYGFSYRDFQNDYIVSSHHELAKLFMLDFMAKFNLITDSSFEGSAALAVLANASGCFSDQERKAAQEVRDRVRNPWAHCDSDEWDDNKYLDCFRLMENLVTVVSKQNTTSATTFFDAAKIISNLRAWKDDGLKLLGEKIELQLLNKVFEAHAEVMKKLAKENVEIENFKSQQAIVDKAIRELKECQTKTEADHHSTEGDPG